MYVYNESVFGCAQVLKNGRFCVASSVECALRRFFAETAVADV